MLKFEGTDKIRDIKYEDGYVDKIYYDNNTLLVFTSDKEKTGVDEVLFKGRKLVDVTSYGKCVQTNLPLGYTQLEYIESSGTQYIDTGFTFETSTKIEFTIERLGTNAGYEADSSRGNVWFGANGSTGTENMLGWGNSGSTNYFRGIAGLSFYSLPLNTKTNIIFDYTKGAIKLFVNSVQQGNTGAETSSVNKRVLLGGVVDNANPYVLYCLERFYDGVKIWNDDILVANFIPAKRNSDNIIGMYDLVSGQFFTNAGTGNFIAGPDAVPTPDKPIDIVCNNGVLKVRHQSGLPLGYTQVDGINNSPTAYVNTGLCPTVDDVEFEIRTKASTLSSWYLFQSRTSSGTTIYGISGSSSGATILLSCGGTNLTSNITRTVGNIYTIKASLKNGVSTLYVKDETAGVEDTITRTYTYSQPTADICLFGNTTGSQTLNANNTIYYARLKVSGEYVMDYIPAMQGSTVGFYDKVSNSLKTEATGTLTAGDSVSDPIEIYTDGTVETIWAHGKNLFDVNTMLVENKAIRAGSVSADKSLGSEIDNNTWNCTDYISVLPDTTYTYTIPKSTYATAAGTVFYSNKSVDGAISGISQNESLTMTFTTPSNCQYVRFSWRSGNGNDVQLEQSPTATDYVPYYDGGTATAEMLLKVGDYQDEQSIIDGVVTRNVGVKVFNGTESFNSGQASGVLCVQITKEALGISSDTLPVDSLDLICTHYKVANGSDWDQSKLNTIKVGSGYLFFNTQYVRDSTSFNQYLADQYAAGTPVTVIYPLAQAVTEQVAPQVLNVQTGDNILEITQASLSNLDLEVKYK